MHGQRMLAFCYKRGFNWALTVLVNHLSRTPLHTAAPRPFPLSVPALGYMARVHPGSQTTDAATGPSLSPPVVDLVKVSLGADYDVK